MDINANRFNLNKIRADINRELLVRLMQSKPVEKYNPRRLFKNWLDPEFQKQAPFRDVDTEALKIIATLEFEKNRNPDDIVAQLRFECARRLDFNAVRRQNVPLREVLHANIIVQVQEGKRCCLTKGDNSITFIVDKDKNPKSYSVLINIPIREQS